MKILGLGFLLISLGMLAACSKPPQPSQSSSPATADARIEQIPAADPQKYGGTRDVKSWRNPYLVVKNDGIWLVDVTNNEERPLDADHVLSSLAALPTSAWPYGRVVAVQEVGKPSSDADRAALRRNRAILAGTLESAKVLINWVPSA